MKTIIYTDFFLAKLMRDVKMWYNENYYPKNFVGPKPELDQHLQLLLDNYDYDMIEGNNVAEKRVNYLTAIQIIMMNQIPS